MHKETMDIDRRNFIIGSSALTLCAALPKKSFSALPRQKLYNIHTRETFDLVDIHDPMNLSEAYEFLRDFRTGDIHEIDKRLLKKVCYVAEKLGKSGETIEVISGYRSPKTNANLASKSSGVAKKSFHMQGRAIDIRIHGASIDEQFEAARSLQLGGVGKYTKSQFIHLDTGYVRSWGS